MVKNISRYCPFNQHYFKIILIKQHCPMCPFLLASCYSQLLFGTVIAVRVNITDICKPREKDHKLKQNWLLYYLKVQDRLLLILPYIVFIDVRKGIQCALYTCFSFLK
jgi:hypothetical protein